MCIRASVKNLPENVLGIHFSLLPDEITFCLHWKATGNVVLDEVLEARWLLSQTLWAT